VLYCCCCCCGSISAPVCCCCCCKPPDADSTTTASCAGTKAPSTQAGCADDAGCSPLLTARAQAVSWACRASRAA
jgi:hypothetical protein